METLPITKEKRIQYTPETFDDFFKSVKKGMLIQVSIRNEYNTFFMAVPKKALREFLIKERVKEFTGCHGYNINIYVEDFKK